jgi:hypothetical protein
MEIFCNWTGFLNSQGDHAQRSRFLRLFWEMVSSKIENCPILDFEKAEVSLKSAY